MKIPYKKVLEMQSNVHLIRSDKKDKLAWAVEEHLIPEFKTALTPYYKELNKLRQKHAAVGKDNEILFEEKVNQDGSRNYKYTKDGATALEVDVEALQEKEADFENYIATDFTRANAFHASVKELYNGIVWQMEIKKPSEDDYNEGEEVKIVDPKMEVAKIEE